MKNLLALFLFLLSSFLLFPIALSAQTWERYIGTEVWEEAGAITTTKDKGMVVAGRKGAQVYVRRLDQDGHLIWENTYLGENPPKEDIAFDIIQTIDGGFALTGRMGLLESSNYNVFLLKLDKNGQQEWVRNFGGSDKDIGYSLAQTEDQGFIVAGAYGITIANNADNTKTSSSYLIKTDADGITDWIKIYGDTLDDFANSVIPLPNGELVLHGIKGSSDRGIEYAYMRVAENGDSLWTKTYGTASDDWATNAFRTEDGGFLQTGYTFGKGTYLVRYQENGDTLWSRHFGINNTFFQDIALGENRTIYNISTNLDGENEDVILMAIDLNGEELWSKEIGIATQNERSVAIATTTDGDIILLGSVLRSTLPAGVQSDILLIKTNEEGNSLNFHVRGEVFVEELEDCSSMDGIPLKEWLIEAKGSSTSYTQTDENGQYDLLLDTGTYEVRVIPISPYWQSCVTEKMVIATDFGDSIVNFGVRPEQRCPWMSIDLSTPFLQPCDTATYTISYENQGTNNADAAFIELTFPPELAVVSSDVSWQQLGPLYTFSTEDIIAPFEKHTFQVDALLNCEVLPQATHSVKAHIFPDSLCLLPNENWDGSSLKVVANYQADSIALVIKNIGEKMTTSSSFVVIEDLVILRQGNILLDQNDSLLILLPINDRTYRLEVEQARFHPGTSRPAISIEAFTIDETAVFSTGFVTQFYEDDGDDFISIDAKENTELPANNRLIAAPKGIGANRLIDPKEDIEYQIIFPIYKLDTDSLMRLVIRDSLSEYLDLATFQAGTSSHAYNVQITETGVLKFIFENIPVPLQDTTYGFVKFKIGQKESNQAGLLIENQVRFYRDYDLPATFYIYQHNTGKIVKEENLQSTYCEGMDYEEVPLKDTISNLSFDIINTYEVTELPNIIMEKNTVVNRNGQQILRDTFVAHNGCDSIVIYNSLTDIEEVILAQEAVLVHPNPVQNYLTISCSNQEDFLTSLQLYSSNGQVIKTPILPDFSKNFRLDLQVVPNGLYSLLITTNESIIYAKVLVLH